MYSIVKNKNSSSIRIAYVDMWENFQPEHFRLNKILGRQREIIIDNENPEFIICGCMGKDYLKYDCIRIQVLGEALVPDFNVYDYAVGFDRIQFGSRYLRCPLYVFYNTDFELAKKKHELSNEFYMNKKKFCNFIVSNGKAMPEREEFFYKLTGKRKIDSAGRYLNNMENGENVANKLEFQRDYKFSLAFENSIIDGYVTEKIIQAWAAATIPIYLGGNGIEKEFNERAFIDVSKFDSFDACIDYILWLDDNPTEYIKMMREPIILPGYEVDYEMELIKFFEYIFENREFQRNSKLTLWGREYEERLINASGSIKEYLGKKLKKISWLRKL